MLGDLPYWLDYRCSQYGSLDPTVLKHANFILSVATDNTVHPFTDTEIALARETFQKATYEELSASNIIKSLGLIDPKKEIKNGTKFQD